MAAKSSSSSSMKIPLFFFCTPAKNEKIDEILLKQKLELGCRSKRARTRGIRSEKCEEHNVKLRSNREKKGVEGSAKFIILSNFLSL